MAPKAKRSLAGFLALALALVCAGFNGVPMAGAAEANLAKGKEATVSRDSGYAHLVAKNLTDGDPDTRWSAEDGPEQWFYIDLGQEQEVSRVRLTWEKDGECAKDFSIFVSAGKDEWGKPVKAVTGNTKKVTDVALDKVASGRYVKVLVSAVSNYPNVSCGEIEVFGEGGSAPSTPETEAVNLALKKDTKASVDYHKQNGARAVDGKKKDAKNDRWMTETKPSADEPQWLAIDLGESQTIKYFEAMWENADNYSTKFKIYVSSDEACWNDPAGSKAWGEPVYSTDGNKDAVSKIELAKPATGRYIKLEISEVLGWGASCMEFEAWNELPPAPEKQPADYLNDIVIDPVTADTKTLGYTLPKDLPAGYEIKYNGTDYEQVIDADGTIYHPLVDTAVKASFKVYNTKDASDYAFKEFEVVVPGTMKVAEQGNAAPLILPQLREWAGAEGAFKAAAAQRVLYGDSSLKVMAEEFAADYAAITGVKPSVAQGNAAAAGDILFALTTDASKGLKDEGYLLDVRADKMVVTAEAVAGANWGGKTILQGMKTGDNSFPCGVARDYPLFKVRGLILDVGRKTFTMDWLKMMTKQMAWFKLNDFQVHLNDNYIPIEQYTNAGEDVFKAYNAFRLESDVKKGGNNGLNQADLTASDVWYTKAEFKDFIEESAALGVNIIPEIDTPAHSLALTKVRPDLRHGTDGRQNDHLNLTTRYEDSLEFVTGIFDEYVEGGDNSVFAGTDVIHIGADEYTADGNAYRRFVNDLFKYAEGNGKTARVWGSLSTIKGTVDVSGVSEGGQRRQMDLWNPGWADMKSMYDLGFELIDCQDGVFYIVPNATYYYDYLGDAAYTDALNSISGYTVPAGDPQMVGGAFAVWNDMCDKAENGMSEYDIYERINHSAGLFGANGWGKGDMSVADAKAAADKLGDAPNTNFGYDKAADANGYHAQWNMDGLEDGSANKADLVEGANAAIEKVDGRTALRLNGGKSYVSVANDALETLGLGNDLRVKVKRTSDSTEPQVLFASEYGAVMAVQKDTGRVGITRENRDYSFGYTLPVNEWVELEIKNEFELTHLLVNGKLVDTIGTNERGKVKATSMLPVNQIGSTKNAFEGYVDDVRLSTAREFASTMPLDYAMLSAEAVLSVKDIPGMRALLDQAQELIHAVDPDPARVSALAEQINGELAKAEYQKADYCRIDAYGQLQLTNEATKQLLSELFTAESLAELQAAWAGVRPDLPASMQETVNGYERAIVKALDGLEPNGARNLNFVDQGALTATANHSQGGAEPEKALDGDLESMWHTKWDTAVLPHWIDIARKDGGDMTVDGLVYTPRAGAGNGTAKKYKIEVSSDGKAYTEVKSGSLEVTDGAKTIEFEKVTTKHVRFVITESVGNFGSAAEINLSDANAKGDFEGLGALLADAKLIKKDLSCDHDAFTDDTWSVLQGAIEKAEASIKAGTDDVNGVHDLKVELAKAIVGLRLDGSAANPEQPEGPALPEKPERPEQPQQKPEQKPQQGKPGAQGGLPQTGDNTMLMVGGFVAVAVIIIVIGVVLRRKNK